MSILCLAVFLVQTISSSQMDHRSDRWHEIRQIVSTWDNEVQPQMSAHSLWRVSEGDDEDVDDDDDGDAGREGDDDTDRALEESLSTDDDLLEAKKNVAFSLGKDEDSSAEELKAAAAAKMYAFEVEKVTSGKSCYVARICSVCTHHLKRHEGYCSSVWGLKRSLA